MRTLKLNIPDTIDFDDREALLAIACRFYEKGKLTLGQSAQLAGMSKEVFMETLGGFGVSVLNHPASDLDRDIDNARGYHI
jgi:predicted HTH domain antitoxin